MIAMKIGFQGQKKLEDETKWSKDSFQVEEIFNVWCVQTAQKEKIMLPKGKVIAKKL